MKPRQGFEMKIMVYGGVADVESDRVFCRHSD